MLLVRFGDDGNDWLASLTADQVKYCCTRMVNKTHRRPRGTIWDNRGLLVYEVVGWEGALAAIGQMAALAAFENGTNDPYKSARFFGPKLWGKSEAAKGRC